MTVPDPSYITADEVKANILVTGLKDGSTGALSDDDINTLILTAEDQIDAFCGPQPHHPYDDNLTRVFPRAQDFVVVVTGGVRRDYPELPDIPYNVSRACLRQVEFLYTQWWPTRATTELPTRYAVQSQSIGGDGSYSETRARPTDFSSASLCDQAKLLLTNFRSSFCGIGTTDVRTSVPPLRDC